MKNPIPIDQAMQVEMTALTALSDGKGSSRYWLWESTQCLVVPRSFTNLPRFNTAVSVLETLGWPIVLRHTGGGITPQGPGIVNASMVFTSPLSDGIGDTFDALCHPIENTLQEFGFTVTRGSLLGAFCDGSHNILADGQKFAGTAQRQRRCRQDPTKKAVLAHAVMLTNGLPLLTLTAINTFLTHLGMSADITADQHADISGRIKKQTLFARLNHHFRSSPHLGSYVACQEELIT